MFNHARTLLLNISGANSSGLAYIGDDLIPPQYTSSTLNTPLLNIRQHLFGAAPDRAMLNYRSYQLLSMIEKTELQEFVADLDSRITYEFGADNIFVSNETWNPKVYQTGGTLDHILTLSGSPTRPDYTGKLYYQFQINLSGTSISIARQVGPTDTTDINYSLTDGLSPGFDLTYTGYQIFVNTMSNLGGWHITGYLRPQLSLSSIVESLEKAGDPTLTALFGTKSIEPWSTFKNLWYDSSDVIYRLGAITLALIYRTDELKGGSRG
jgi:hypothetical protein